jgi:hypothetical protein
MPTRRRVIREQIHFKADLVVSLEEKYTPDFVVHGIYFGEGDPEQDGQYWNFTRSLGDDDDGVCTVKEIQEVTVYGGIERFTLTRQSLLCEFDGQTAKETEVRQLLIEYSINENEWQSLVKQAKKVFDGEKYFEVTA